VVPAERGLWILREVEGKRARKVRADLGQVAFRAHVAMSRIVSEYCVNREQSRSLPICRLPSTNLVIVGPDYFRVADDSFRMQN
jgi:hypothetical protein